jgi:hypothetical protein
MTVNPNPTDPATASTGAPVNPLAGLTALPGMGGGIEAMFAQILAAVEKSVSRLAFPFLAGDNSALIRTILGRSFVHYHIMAQG